MKRDVKLLDYPLIPSHPLVSYWFKLTAFYEEKGPALGGKGGLLTSRAFA